MRLPLLALLCAGTAAFCQSPSAGRVGPDRLFQMPQRFSAPAREFQVPEFDRGRAILGTAILGSPLLARPLETLVLPGPMPLAPDFNGSRVDPQIILRPPWPKRGDQPGGKDVARNLYPGLKFLPVHHDRPK